MSEFRVNSPNFVVLPNVAIVANWISLVYRGTPPPHIIRVGLAKAARYVSFDNKSPKEVASPAVANVTNSIRSLVFGDEPGFPPAVIPLISFPDAFELAPLLASTISPKSFAPPPDENTKKSILLLTLGFSPPNTTARVLLPVADALLFNSVKSPKSTAFPSVAISTLSSEFTLLGVSPPQNTPLPLPPPSCLRKSVGPLGI